MNSLANAISPLHFFKPMWEGNLHFKGWSVGAMVLGKLPVLGRLTNLDFSRARAFFACSMVHLNKIGKNY